MRVQGNTSPDVMLLEPYHPLQGYVELRLRENIEVFSENLCEYDEYTFLLKDREGLREDIEVNLTDWLITGRMLEVNEMSSAVQDMKQALEILGVKTDEN